MGYRCEQCDMIPLVRIHNPSEYILCIDSFQRMIDKGEMELVYKPAAAILVDKTQEIMKKLR